MKKLYIIGSGGFGREVLWLAQRINQVKATWDIIGFIDDDETLHGTMQDNYPILGGCAYLGQQEEDLYAVIAIGSAKIKKAIAERLSRYKQVHFATLIDPAAILSKRTEIGEGSIICAGTAITVDVVIGRHVTINLDCTFGHDDVIGDFATIYPGVHISGNVRIGEEVELGTGMQVIQGKQIGKNSIVGAGAVVIEDIPDHCTAVGNPARVIKCQQAQ